MEGVGAQPGSWDEECSSFSAGTGSPSWQFLYTLCLGTHTHNEHQLHQGKPQMGELGKMKINFVLRGLGFDSCVNMYMPLPQLFTHITFPHFNHFNSLSHLSQAPGTSQLIQGTGSTFGAISGDSRLLTAALMVLKRTGLLLLQASELPLRLPPLWGRKAREKRQFRDPSSSGRRHLRPKCLELPPQCCLGTQPGN